MFCKYCGAKVDEDSIYCSNCGQKFSHLLSEVHKTNDDFRSSTQELDKQKNGTSSILNYERNDKYDILFNENKKLVKYGLLLIILHIIIVAIISFTGNSDFYAVASVILICLRVWIIVMVVKMADSMNRNAVGWGILSFLTPTLAMIILGIMKKKLYPRNYSYFSSEQKSRYLNDYACKLARKGILDLAEFYIDQALVLDSKNHFAYDTRGVIRYNRKEYLSAIEDFDISIEMDESFGEKYYNRGMAKYSNNDNDGAVKDLQRAVEMGFTTAAELLNRIEKN